MGISSHSTDRTLYIFSVMKSDKTALENSDTHTSVKEYFMARGLKFTEVQGLFRGVHETGFLMDATHVPEEAINLYSRLYKQECYLTLTQHRHGVMKAVFIDATSGRPTKAGFFRSLDEATVKALKLDYTYRPDVNTYWVIWPTDTTSMEDFEEEVNFAKAHGFAALWL